MRSLASVSALVAVALVVACDDEPRTELVVVVDSDMRVPSELDRIEIDVLTPSEETLTSAGDLASEPLPRSLGVLYESGALSPVEVVVRGIAGGDTVVERRASTGFVKDKTIVLLVGLLRSCAGMSCTRGQTCGEDGCESPDVPGVTLPVWDGDEPRLGGASPPPPPPIDGGARDTGAGDAGDAGTRACGDECMGGGRQCCPDGTCQRRC